MFLDPDPKGRNSNMSTAWIPATPQPIISLRDHRKNLRKSWHERPRSQHKRRPSSRNSEKTIIQRRVSSRSPEKTTVRLVKHSPAPSLARSVKTISSLKEHVHDGHKLNEVQRDEPVPKFGLGLETQPEYSSTASLRSDQTLTLDTESVWHQRNLSAGTFSDTSTLKGSEVTLTQSQSRRSENTAHYSLSSTLLGSPSLKEQQTSFIDNSDMSTLTTPPILQVEFPISQTVRAVPPSTSSGSSTSDQRSEVVSMNSPGLRASMSRSETDLALPAPLKITRRRTLSAGSALSRPRASPSRASFDLPMPRQQRSQESIAFHTNTTLSLPSSPNFVAYTPSIERPRSATSPLHYMSSYDSISSRLQYPAGSEPHAGPALASSSSWGSLLSSDDTLPPLDVPKKRLRSRSTSESLRARHDTSQSSSSTAQAHNTDKLHYPRHVFSHNLSTIASESDRSGSQHLSLFSLGSRFSAGVDRSSVPGSGTWTENRLDSVPPTTSPSHRLSLHLPGTTLTAGEEPGDMTLGIFREASAKPEPLFKLTEDGRGASLTRHADLPFLSFPPPTSHEADEEDVDTITALQSPVLRQKRSGYSIRKQRSNTSLTHARQASQASHVESDRWSIGSNIFPLWAKHFYAGNAVLVTKPSMSSISNPRTRPTTRSRSESNYSEPSVSGQRTPVRDFGEFHGTNIDDFIPSIFRPIVHTRSKSEVRRVSLRSFRRSRRPIIIEPTAQSDDSTDQRDSLSITPAPLPNTLRPPNHRHNRHHHHHSRPQHSSAPAAPPPHPIPSRRSSRGAAAALFLPRGASTDTRASEFTHYGPRLAPTRRSHAQQHTAGRLSCGGTWRPPSFAGSLDTLVRERGNRQVLLFVAGFVFPIAWFVAAVLPLPGRASEGAEVEGGELEKGGVEAVTAQGRIEGDGDTESVDARLAARRQHQQALATEIERRWVEERTYIKARWWRMLNRVMSVVGVLLIAAVIALAVVATR